MRPGELSLANNGVLFLDELAEFIAPVLDGLRQPLEEGVVRVSRARATVAFPAKILLVAAMNPCPCGEGGKPGGVPVQRGDATPVHQAGVGPARRPVRPAGPGHASERRRAHRDRPRARPLPRCTCQRRPRARGRPCSWCRDERRHRRGAARRPRAPHPSGPRRCSARARSRSASGPRAPPSATGRPHAVPTSTAATRSSPTATWRSRLQLRVDPVAHDSALPRVNGQHDIACAVALADLPMMGPLAYERCSLGGRPLRRGKRWRRTAPPTTHASRPRAGVTAATCGRCRRAPRSAPTPRPRSRVASGRESQCGCWAGPTTPPRSPPIPSRPRSCFALGDLAHIAATRARRDRRHPMLPPATGLELARRLGRELTDAGVAIVSGLALRHRRRGPRRRGPAPHLRVGRRRSASSAAGSTCPYPRTQPRLWRDVAAAGVLISEAPLGARRRRRGGSLPRNRLIAALADSSWSSSPTRPAGRCSRSREADRRGRQVMAVPGSVRSPASEGTNQLISDGCAPVRDATDVLVALGLTAAHRERRAAARRRRPSRVDGAVLARSTLAMPLDRRAPRAARPAPLPTAGSPCVASKRAGWVTRSGAAGGEPGMTGSP